MQSRWFWQSQSRVQSRAACFTPELDALEGWTRSEFARLEPVLKARKAAGCVRECHGDLHLGNMVLLPAAPPPGRPKAGPKQEHAERATSPMAITTLPVASEHSEQVVSPAPGRGLGGGGQIVLFDCIEFNDDFRWIDVASEIAFALVDLLDHRQPGLACWLLNEWLVETGDFAALKVLRFYMAYRALVRAKVAAIRACQQEVGTAADCPEVRDYLALAQRISLRPSPTLLITHGLAGCGKTTLTTARLLADAAATTIRLRSDVERKRLYGLAAQAASGSPLDGGIYTPEAHARTYARLAELADAALADGWSVIVDAAFLRRAERDAFHALAQRHGAAFAIIAPQAAPAELARRIEARRARGDASEATLEVLERQRGYLEPLGDDEAVLPG